MRHCRLRSYSSAQQSFRSLLPDRDSIDTNAQKLARSLVVERDWFAMNAKNEYDTNSYTHSFTVRQYVKNTLQQSRQSLFAYVFCSMALNIHKACTFSYQQHAAETLQHVTIPFAHVADMRLHFCYALRFRNIIST